MLNRTVITFIVQIWITLLLGMSVAQIRAFRGELGAPVIDPYDPDVTYEYETIQHIECKGKEPVTWWAEKNLIGDETLEVTHKEMPDEIYRYFTYLNFINTSNYNVGRYYCVFSDKLKKADDTEPDIEHYDEEVEMNYASTIYVFVEDPDVLLVDPANKMHILVEQYQNITIPCKPTSKSVEVELKKDGIKVNGSYDITSGFKYEVIDLIGDWQVKCVGYRNGIISYHYLNYDIMPLTQYIEKPTITSNSNFMAFENKRIELECSVVVGAGVNYLMQIKLPNSEIAKTNEFYEVSSMEEEDHDHDSKKIGKIKFTIFNTDADRDDGEYKCIITDYHSNTNHDIKRIKIIKESFIKLSADITTVNTKYGAKSAKVVVKYEAYPIPLLSWHNNKNETISQENTVYNMEKYNVLIKPTEVIFTIKHPELADIGNYTLQAKNDDTVEKFVIQIFVKDKPLVTLENTFVREGEDVNMICKCIGYPPSSISWSFRSCQDVTDWPTCGRKPPRIRDFSVDGEEEIDETILQTDSSLSELSLVSQVSLIKFTPKEPGFVTCKARNEVGSDRTNASVMISDLDLPFMIYGYKDNELIAEGEKLTIECGVVIYNYTNKIEWLKDDNPIESKDDIVIDMHMTKFSYRKRITFANLNLEDKGTYKCQVYSADDLIVESGEVFLNVASPEAPVILPNFEGSVMKNKISDQILLICDATGLPVPTVTWYKNDAILQVEENSSRISIDNHTVNIQFLNPEDAGVYRCDALNKIGADSRSINLEITGMPTIRGWIYGSLIMIFILILLSVYLCFKVRNSRRQVLEMKAAGLANFEEGNIESINPDLSLDEQADLLPYDKKYEFPRDKLKFGKQLGAGAFGVVVKAVAQGIVPYEEETVVAVKMVKKQTDNEVMRALVSELKIMVHLGQHLNVVNLLGAVTQNIAKREVMVIVEYCRFGNLQTFLVKHRPHFVDQVDKNTDLIDQNIHINELRWSQNTAYNGYNSQGLKYINIDFSDKTTPHQYMNGTNDYLPIISDGRYTGKPGGANFGAHVNSQGYVRHSGIGNTTVDSCNTEATLISTNGQEESVALSNNSEQPLWRSNIGTDYKGPARPVNTSDLICWSFQVARGMDYLASRKVLHGDLAARNILLCEDNIVKICDFGLARSMYKNDNYKKKGEAPLPFKWLALESISEHVFSTYSDVWAFGIVLWELFSLGKVPYTGMEANQNLFYKLRDGYRMEKPQFANQDVYDIMLNCWNVKPESRPSFTDLEQRLGALLQDGVKDHYVDLNEHYLAMNVENLADGQTDYLALLGPPTDQAPPTPAPRYINSSTMNIDIPNRDGSPSNYLAMSPKSGTVRYSSGTSGASRESDYVRPDSPTIRKNLDSSPRPKARQTKKPEIPEEIPMLARNQNGVHNSDEENDIISPVPSARSKFLNFNEVQEQQPEYRNIMTNDNNYVNVPSNIANNKPFGPNKDAFANPSYVTFNNVNERVN